MLAIPTVEIRTGLDDDPKAVARTWTSAGFSRIHVVDLDAINGIGSNASVVDDLIRDAGVEVQANGGVQTTDGVQRLIDAGATRVVVGTRGVADPDWLASVAEVNSGIVVVETALRERRVVVRGWVRSLPVDIFDLVEELNGLPLAGLLVSANQADGSRGVTDLSLIEDIVEASEFPVLASGGVLTLNDLRALDHRGVSAVVLGSVLTTGALDARTVAQEFGG